LEDNFTIRVNNYNCVKTDVKLLYTKKEGDNGMDDLDTKVKKTLTMTTDDWGGGFLDEEGKTWSADGQTLPYAFSSSIQIVFFVFPTGNITLSTNVGEPIDAFLFRLMQVLAAGYPSGESLSGTSPMGAQIFYNGDTCFIRLVQYVPSGGGAQVIPLQWTITSIFPTTSFDSQTLSPLGYTLRHPDNWSPFIEVRDLADSSLNSYKSLLNSLLGENFFIDDVRRYSTSTAQINEALEYVRYDSDGNTETITQTGVVDPYQIQPVVTDYTDVVIDGQTYQTVTMLEGEFIELTYTFQEFGGRFTYEQLRSLDELLERENIERVKSGEERELREVYSNFSGFSGVTNPQNIIIGLLVLYIIANGKA
jgi:hypothetical protein